MVPAGSWVIYPLTDGCMPPRGYYRAGLATGVGHMGARLRVAAVLGIALLATFALLIWSVFGLLRELRATSAAIDSAADLARVGQQVHDLQRERGLATLRDNGSLFDDYSSRIAALGEQQPAALRAALPDRFRAVRAAGDVKEAIAQERGYLSRIFTAGEFRQGQYERFVAMQVRREIALVEFDRAATEGQRVALYRVLNSEAAVRVARYEAIAISGAQGRLPERVDPVAWWAAATQVVDELHTAHQAFTGDAAAQAQELRGSVLRDIGIAVALATLAVIAELALLFRRNRAKAPDAAGLVTEINSKLLGGASIDDCWEHVANRLTELTPASCVLIMLSSDGRMRFAACVGPGADELLGMRIAVESSDLADVAATGAPLVIDDITRHVWATSTTLGPGAAVPLRSRRQVCGVLLAARNRGDAQFHREDVDRLVSLCGPATVALVLAENQEAKRRTVLLDDRDRIAQDMYYLVMRRLMTIGITLQGVLKLISSPHAQYRVETAIDQLDETMRQMRSSIFELQVAGEYGLRQQLLELVVEAVDGTDLLPVISMPGTVDTLVPETVATHVVVVVREAVGAIVKHARAKELAVSIELTEWLTISVVHNGSAGAFGAVLGELERRAAVLDGTCSVYHDDVGRTELTWVTPLEIP